MNKTLTRFGGFFVACVLSLPAHSITVTEARKPVVVCKIDKTPVSCAYLKALLMQAKSRCPECDWKLKKT